MGADDEGGRPSVELLTATEDPERIICTAARNDYWPDYVGDTPFNELMESIEPTPDDVEWARAFLTERGAEYEINVKPIAKKRRLISKLLERGHFGPFEHVTATFAVKNFSRSGMAQLTRHRHVSFDVQSMRYVAFDDKNPRESVVHVPELENPAPSGRNAEVAEKYADLEDDELLDLRNEVYWSTVKRSFYKYQQLLDLGMAPENARMVLPIGTQVNLVFSLNARMLMHVADMRAAGDAQFEIRDLTEQVLDLAADWCPITFDYYEEHMKGRKNRLAP